MGISVEQGFIIAGWGVRGAAALASLLVVGMRPTCQQSRILMIAFFMLVITLGSGIAEYFDLALRYSRLTELTVASLFVAGIYGAIFKIDPSTLFFGTIALVASNFLYIMAAVTSSTQLEAGLLVTGGVAAVVALLQLGKARLTRDPFEWVLVVVGALFYGFAILITIFGPWVLNEWNREAWIIGWEVAGMIFYPLLAMGAWFLYTPGTVDEVYESDWFDMIAYALRKNQWAEPRRKIAE